jgi:phosphoenolpyruvate carboxykinase (GTP)
MIDRLEGKVQGEDHAFGIGPTYNEITWEGLDFSAEQFASITDMNPVDWAQELALHTEHFQKLAYHLPQALVQTQDQLTRRILG